MSLECPKILGKISVVFPGEKKGVGHCDIGMEYHYHYYIDRSPV